jgi:DNA-binding SARP family transcriptional activator
VSSCSGERAPRIVARLRKTIVKRASGLGSRMGEMMPTSELTTLGGFAFSANGSSAPRPDTQKGRALMAFLALNPRTDISRERLLELFWPDTDPEHARNRLKTALSNIRRCVKATGLDPDDCIVANKAVVRWTTDTTVDAQQFAALATHADPAASQEALQLYRGDFLEGDYDDWSVTERERLAALYESVLARAVRTKRDPEAARRLLERNQYAEEAYAVLIEAELGAGRSTSATELAERCRQAL